MARNGKHQTEETGKGISEIKGIQEIKENTRGKIQGGISGKLNPLQNHRIALSYSNTHRRQGISLVLQI